MSNYQYHIHSKQGTVKNFISNSDDKAKDIFLSDKSLPKDEPLDLNRFDPDLKKWTHICSLITISKSINREQATKPRAD